MAIKKLGAPTGMFDADSNEIHVGDILKDSEGKEFTVDKFQHIVSLPYKFCDTRKPRCFTISRKWDEEEVKLPPVEEAPATEVEAAVEAEAEVVEERVELTPTLDGFQDSDLADELRKRGYTVIAYKTVMVPTTVEL